MANLIDSLNTTIADWVRSHPFRSPFSPDNTKVAGDAVKIITLESGGNPYAVNDNTTGQSYQFSNYQTAADYVTSNKSHTMAIGLFQLLTHDGMGSAYSDNPAELLDPQTQFNIAIPQIIQNDTGVHMPSLDPTVQFNQMLGDAWYADRGMMDKLTTSNIAATVTRLGGSAANSDAGILHGTTLPLNEAIIATNPANGLVGDMFSKIWSMNSLYVIGGSLAILLILVNVAKGGVAK